MTQTGKAVSRVPTLRDVARYAGVSHTTVSRVVNGDRIVTEQTRIIVEQAIAALNFVPNPTARALSGMRQVRIGLLHRFPNPGSLGESLVHLLNVASEAHTSLIVREVSPLTDYHCIADELADGGVAGVILSPPLADVPGLLDTLYARGIAAVAVGSNRQKARIVSVGIDDRQAAGAITRHLLALGHSRIGFICGDPQFASTELRLAGYQEAMAEAGFCEGDDLIARGSYTYQSGLVAAERLLGLAERPTAIFASNDDMAAAAVAVAHRQRLDIPEHLSVCGFDDAALATTIWPALTTIRRPTLGIIQGAFHQLLSQVLASRMDPVDRQITFDYQLVRRQSDGPPP